MKNTMLRVLGYYLYVQAGIAVLNIGSQPENAAFLLVFAAFSGWGGYEVIKRGRPKHLPAPETQPLSAIQQARAVKIVAELEEIEARKRAN